MECWRLVYYGGIIGCRHSSVFVARWPFLHWIYERVNFCNMHLLNSITNLAIFFSSIQCHRLSVHKNLVIAFILYYILNIIFWEPVLTGVSQKRSPSHFDHVSIFFLIYKCQNIFDFFSRNGWKIYWTQWWFSVKWRLPIGFLMKASTFTQEWLPTFLILRHLSFSFTYLDGVRIMLICWKIPSYFIWATQNCILYPT